MSIASVVVSGVFVDCPIIPCSYLGCWHGPDFVVIWRHEILCNTFATVPQNPFVEIFGFGVDDTCFERSVNQTVHALDLVLSWKRRDIVLEWIWYPKTLESDIGDALVGIPVISIGECFVYAVVEVLVV